MINIYSKKENKNFSLGFTPSLENRIAKSGRRPMRFFSAGFTVLEAIIAITIVSLAIGGVFSAVRTSLVASTASQDEITAFYLAQEALEALRNKRDQNKLVFINSGTGGWLSGIANTSSAPCYHGSTCTIDVGGAVTASPPTSPAILTKCTGGWGSCPVLKTGPTFLYGYDGSWVDTKFKREIQIECTGGASACGTTSEILITISVKWSRGSANNDLKVKTIMRDWR